MAMPTFLSPAPAAVPPMTAARALLLAFARRGVRAAFGIPGGLSSPLFDALLDVPEIRSVSCRHEGMASFSAMGHALATGHPALVITTGGPGLTNAITGVAAAYVEQLPLVLIAGDVAGSSAARGAIQDSSTNGIDSVAMLRTITRWSARIESAEGAVAAAEQAMAVATGPRPGPVFLSVPIDVCRASVGLPWFTAAAELRPSPADAGACAEVARALSRAKRPLLVVGNGARRAHREVLDLAERLAIPVVTTPHAKGIFPESHRLHLGIIGLGGHPSASRYLAAGPDVTLIVGSRLGDLATNGWTLPVRGSEATIQIDREPLLIGRNCPVTLGVVADAGTALEGILASLPRDVGRPRQVTQGIERHHRDWITSNATPLKQPRVLGALQEAFPDALFTVDQGEHCAFALHYLEIDGPDRFRSMVGLASMGSGIGVAIGARHASSHRPVICICGDGGFAMHAGEILTCVEHGIDVMFVVMNDGRWNMVHHGFSAIFGRVPEQFPTHVANLAGVAESFGAVGAVARAPVDLDPERLRSLLRFKRPVLLDVRVDGEDVLSIESRISAVKSFAMGGAE
jgi:acetolactate synthase I/II/III large subunit